MAEYRKGISQRINSTNRTPKQGSPAISSKAQTRISPSGYELKLSITPEGIVQEGKGVVYCSTAAGDFIPTLMSDGRGVLHKVVRSVDRKDIPTKGISASYGATGTGPEYIDGPTE